MIKLYFAPMTRAIRILWLFEELGLEHELERIEFQPPSKNFFSPRAPLGRVPVIEDGDTLMCESGAIIQYVLERYGNGRLAPAIDSPQRGAYLQWMSFAESSAYAPLGVIVTHTMYRTTSGEAPAAIQTATERAHETFDFLEEQLGDKEYFLGEFSAADIMMGFTLGVARILGLLGDRHPVLSAYMERIDARPAFQRAMAVR